MVTRALPRSGCFVLPRPCVLIGRWGDFLACKNRPRLEERKTFLREMIREEQQAFTARCAAAWEPVAVTDAGEGEGEDA